MIATNTKTATRNFCLILISINFKPGEKYKKNPKLPNENGKNGINALRCKAFRLTNLTKGDTPWNPGCLGEARQSLAFVHVRTEATPSTREERLYGWFQGNIGGPPDTPCPDGRRVKKAKGCHHDTQF